ncbi:MAG: efflux RND transporter permease subunit [Thermoplasmatota archaeon]
MITERVGIFTTRYPWIGILLILLITAASVGAMITWPMEQSFDQEDFLPDMEVAKASTTYSEKFTSSYSFLVLIRSETGDMVTKEGFLDTILLSEQIVENGTFQTYRDKSEQGAYPISPANSLFQIRKAVDFIQDVAYTGGELGSYIPILNDLNSTTAFFIEGISSLNISDEGGISDLVDGFAPELNGTLESVVAPRYGVETPSNASSYYSSMEDDQYLKSEIGRLLSFDPSDPSVNGAVGSMMGFRTAATGVIGELDEATEALDLALSDPEISFATSEILGSLRIDLGAMRDQLVLISGIASAKGNPLAIGQMTQLFYFGQFILVNFMTEDFDPTNGVLSGEGSLLILNLDYSLVEMQEKNLSDVMRIEKEISQVVKDFDESSSLSVHPLPTAVISERINEASNESMMILLPAALGFVVAILAIIYRNLWDTLLNVTALGLAIVWMYGFGSIMGYSSNPMITAVPVLIVGLGIDYGIHLTMRYREEIRKGKMVRESIKAMSGSVGMALLLATFTTVFAFLSNIFSPVGIILQFGVMAAVGILASFFIMMIFVPSVKRLADVRRARKGKPLFGKFREGECDLCNSEVNQKKIVNRIILGLTLRAERHPAVILSVVGIITVGMLGAALNNDIVFDVNDFLPDDLQESKDLGYVLSEFRLGGSGDTGIILVEGNITDPEVLRAMNESMTRAKELGSEHISMEGEGQNSRPNADFILFSLKDTANMLGTLDPGNPFVIEYSATFDINSGLPRENATSADIREVFDMFYIISPSEARSVIYREDGEYIMSAISFTVGTEDDSEAWELYDDLKEISKPIENGEIGNELEVSETGSSIVLAVVIGAMQQSQITSLLITIAVSLIVLTIVFFWEERSIILGTVATLPVVFCVILIAGTMYLTGIPLNVITITIGSLTVGLGITYGIHITHRFIEDIKQEKDLMEASKNTIMNTGSALFGAAATTIGGFGLLSFATMPPLQQFGIVTALAILYSFLSSIVVLPVLLILWAKLRIKWRGRTGRDLFNGKDKGTGEERAVLESGDAEEKKTDVLSTAN